MPIGFVDPESINGSPLSISIASHADVDVFRWTVTTVPRQYPPVQLTLHVALNVNDWLMLSIARGPERFAARFPNLYADMLKPLFVVGSQLCVTVAPFVGSL